MPKFLGSQICPGRLYLATQYLLAGKPSSKYSLLLEPCQTNNGKSFLDIVERGYVSSASALRWLKLSVGTSDAEYAKGDAVRAEFAALLSEQPTSVQNDYIEKVFVDLDVNLIIDAIKDKGQLNAGIGYNGSYQDVINLLNRTIADGGIFGDINGSGNISYPSTTTGSSWEIVPSPEVGLDNYATFNNIYFEGGTGFLTNLNSFDVRITGLMVWLYYQQYQQYTDATQPGTIYLSAGQKVNLRDYSGWVTNTGADINVYGFPGPIVSVRGGTWEAYTTYEYSQTGEEGAWSNTLINKFNDSYYVARKIHAHTNYNDYAPIIGSRVKMSKDRIRTCTATAGYITPDYTNGSSVFMRYEDKFSTDFKYMRKDPNGQFVAGGLARCPTFAGSSSTGNIPDNTKLGYGNIFLHSGYKSTFYSSIDQLEGYYEYAKTFDFSASKTNLIFSIWVPEDIIVPDVPTFLDGQAAVFWGTSSAAMPVTYASRSPTGQYYTLANGQTSWTIVGTTTYLMTTNLTFWYYSPTSGDLIDISFTPEMNKFAVPEGGVHKIKKGYLEVTIPWNWFTGYSAANSSLFGSSTSYANLKGAIDANVTYNRFRIYPVWNSVFGGIEATNFDFVETP